MKNMTLSFDNGPDPEVTPHVLDVLASHNIKTSFFVVGDKLRDPGRRALCVRAAEEGHWIGNHTFNHLVPLGLSRHNGASSFEIGRTQELIGELSHERKFFRPFGGGGHLNAALLDRPAYDYLQRGSFSCVLWNAVPRDWETPDSWPDTALEQAASLQWPLMVLHDLQTGAMKHLDRFIRLAKDAGFVFQQDFPADCVPIDRGEVVQDITAYVSAGGAK